MDNSPPSPSELRVQHLWSVDLYYYVTLICDSILLLAYIYTFFKAWTGTRYSFILLLVTLLTLSSVMGIVGAIYTRRASFEASISDELWSDDIRVSFVAAMLSDICLNVSIWCFSFRYWNISFVMLVRLAGETVSACFKATSITIFAAGLLFNTLVPVLRSYFAFKMNSGSTLQEHESNWY